MSHTSTELRLARVVSALTAATFVLLVFGSTVRVHGAGLACPDWPLCFGEVVPALDFKVYLEFGHRVLAGVIGLVYLGVGAALWRTPHLWSRLRLHWGIGLVALLTQAVLGGLTVLELLAEWTVTSHLLGGNTFSLLLFLLALRLHEAAAPVQRDPVGPVARAAAVVVAVAVFAQLTLGGLVASSHAGLACGTWPGCNGPAWFPTFSGLVGLQVWHRIVAYLVLTAAVVAVAATRGAGRSGRAAAVVLGLVLCQVALGVTNVLLRLPVEITLLHSAGAAAIVLGTTWLVRETFSAPLPETRTSRDSHPAGAPLEAR